MKTQQSLVMQHACGALASEWVPSQPSCSLDTLQRSNDAPVDARLMSLFIACA